MTNDSIERSKPTRSFPKVKPGEGSQISAQVSNLDDVRRLMGMKTPEAAEGAFCAAMNALGASAQMYGQMVAAMFAELEPRDGIEAMLISQMTATHIAMTVASAKLSEASMFEVRESHERSMTRLSRTYLAQMDALKKYRAKAQQVVRVERVTVNEGGQAIVGDVFRAGGGNGKK